MISASAIRRRGCRLCSSNSLTRVISLSPTPPANAFVEPSNAGKKQEVFPLDVYFCEDCSHLQLRDVIDPKILFSDYVYTSGTSPVFVQHFKDYAGRIVERFFPKSQNGLIIDIGSNDGTLLREFKSLGFDVIGVDPAADIAKMATGKGIYTVPDFFTVDTAQKIADFNGLATVVTANNVFAHADDLCGLLDAVKTILSPNGIFVFEVSYLADVIEKTLFDTIYHEHLAYHSVKPLEVFFKAQGMHLFSVELSESHGGSLRGFVQTRGGPFPEEPSVEDYIESERLAGLHQASTFTAFSSKIDRVKSQLTTFLYDLKSEGKSIAGFGAPAKATTLMHHFDLGPEIIDFIVDDSPLKQGLVTPGLHIPVLPAKAIYTNAPDIVVILAWNFAESIRRNHIQYVEQGGCFVVPLPTVEIFRNE